MKIELNNRIDIQNGSFLQARQVTVKSDHDKLLIGGGDDNFLISLIEKIGTFLQDCFNSLIEALVKFLDFENTSKADPAKIDSDKTKIGLDKTKIDSDKIQPEWKVNKKNITLTPSALKLPDDAALDTMVPDEEVREFVYRGMTDRKKQEKEIKAALDNTFTWAIDPTAKVSNQRESKLLIKYLKSILYKIKTVTDPKDGDYISPSNRLILSQRMADAMFLCQPTWCKTAREICVELYLYPPSNQREVNSGLLTEKLWGMLSLYKENSLNELFEKHRAAFAADDFHWNIVNMVINMYGDELGISKEHSANDDNYDGNPNAVQLANRIKDDFIANYNNLDLLIGAIQNQIIMKNINFYELLKSIYEADHPGVDGLQSMEYVMTRFFDEEKSTITKLGVYTLLKHIKIIAQTEAILHI